MGSQMTRRGPSARRVSNFLCSTGRASDWWWAKVRFWRETDPWFAPVSLEFNLLRESKRIVYFHAEIANGGLDLCVSEQKLHRP